MRGARLRTIATFVLDALIVLIAIGCFVYALAIAGRGATFFRWYTNLSNLLAAVACACALPYDVRALQNVRGSDGGALIEMPRWVRVFRLAGLSAAMVTFLTVFLLFGFIVGFLSLLQGTNLFFHLVSPLLMLASCIIGRSSFGLPKRSIALPVLLTAAYAVLYFVKVIVIGEASGGWPDFYGFNTGGIWPVSMVTMMVASTLVSLASRKLTSGKRA